MRSSFEQLGIVVGRLDASFGRLSQGLQKYLNGFSGEAKGSARVFSESDLASRPMFDPERTTPIADGAVLIKGRGTDGMDRPLWTSDVRGDALVGRLDKVTGVAYPLDEHSSAVLRSWTAARRAGYAPGLEPYTLHEGARGVLESRREDQYRDRESTGEILVYADSADGKFLVRADVAGGSGVDPGSAAGDTVALSPPEFAQVVARNPHFQQALENFPQARVVMLSGPIARPGGPAADFADALQNGEGVRRTVDAATGVQVLWENPKKGGMGVVDTGDGYGPLFESFKVPHGRGDRGGD